MRGSRPRFHSVSKRRTVDSRPFNPGMEVCREVGRSSSAERFKLTVRFSTGVRRPSIVEKPAPSSFAGDSWPDPGCGVRRSVEESEPASGAAESGGRGEGGTLRSRRFGGPCISDDILPASRGDPSAQRLGQGRLIDVWVARTCRVSPSRHEVLERALSSRILTLSVPFDNC